MEVRQAFNSTISQAAVSTCNSLFPIAFQVPACVADAIRHHLLFNNAQLGAGHELSNRSTAVVEKAHDVIKASTAQPSAWPHMFTCCAVHLFDHPSSNTGIQYWFCLTDILCICVNCIIRCHVVTTFPLCETKAVTCQQRSARKRCSPFSLLLGDNHHFEMLPCDPALAQCTYAES